MRVSTQLPPHGVWPPLHALVTHAPSTHAWLEGHALPQRPQSPAAVWRSTQVPPHNVWFAAQVHTPAVQRWPPVQTTPTQAASTQVPW